MVEWVIHWTLPEETGVLFVLSYVKVKVGVSNSVQKHKTCC